MAAMDVKKALGGFAGQVKRAAEVAAPVINPVGTAVAKKVGDQFKPAAPAPTPAPAQPSPMDGLGAEQKGKLQAALAGQSGPVAQGVAQAALAQASTLPPAEATKLLNVAAMDLGGPQGASMAKIFASPAWLASTPAQKGQLLDVAATASPKGLESLATLAQQNKLGDTDARGGTLLSNLQKLAMQEQAPEISGSKPEGLSRQQVLDDVLRETSNPSTIHQGREDTCGATALQYELAKRNPGEYARIMAGLTGKEAKVTLAGGQELPLHLDSLDKQPTDTRSGTERLFQSAGIELANGANTYDPTKDTTTNTNGTKRTGLTENEARDLSRQLFGRNGAPTGAQVYDMRATGPDVMVRHLRSANGSKPITLNFAQPNNRGHAVSFDHIEGDRIYFRNPTKPVNGQSNLAGARVESNGLESMTIEQFKRQGRTVTGEID